MTPMIFTVVGSGFKFYGMVNKTDHQVFTEQGVINFTRDEDLERFIEFNSGEETEMVPEKFSFFSI